MATLLRWTGVGESAPRTFMDSRVGERRPGEVFSVSDEDAPGFLAHDGVELALPPEPQATRGDDADEEAPPDAESRAPKTRKPRAATAPEPDSPAASAAE